MHEQREGWRRNEGDGPRRDGREGGLLDLLRRVVGLEHGPRAAVLVMDPDGRMRRVGAAPGDDRD